ncbi:MAG TPA: TolC family protein [Kofleriaceae bacterium]
MDRVVRLADDGTGGSAPAAPQTQDETLTAWAGPAQPITLPELLQHAVQHSPALESARIDIAIAEAQIEQTLSRDDWHIDAQIFASSSSGYISGLRIDRSTTVGATVDVSRLLPTGGTITLHGGSEYQRTTSPFNPADKLTNWSDTVNATYVQPLLQGRGRWLYEANERRAKLSQDSATLAKRLAAINAVQTVVSAYWDLVLAERTIAITQASLDLAKERLRFTQAGVDGGKVPRSELPAVEQIIATREEDILNAELAVLDRSIALRRAAGMPIGAGALGLQVESDVAEGDSAGALGDLTDRAYTASPQLLQFAKQNQVATLDIEVTENGLLPQLDAALTLGPTSQEASFGSAARDLFRTDSFAIQGQLRYQHSIGQENIKGRARELRENQRKLVVNEFDVRAQIAQAMAESVAQMELATRRVKLSERAIELANQNTKLEQDRFNLGKSTNFDVLNRLEEMRQAQLRKTQAIIDWQKARAVTMALTGDILPSYGIAVD